MQLVMMLSRLQSGQCPLQTPLETFPSVRTLKFHYDLRLLSSPYHPSDAANFSVKNEEGTPFGLKKIANSNKPSMASRLAKNRIGAQSVQQPTTPSPIADTGTVASDASVSSTADAATNNDPKLRRVPQNKDAIADSVVIKRITATTPTPDAYDRLIQQSISIMNERRQHRAQADATVAEANAKRRQEAKKVLDAAKSEAQEAQEARRNSQRQARENNNNNNNNRNNNYNNKDARMRSW
jgi:hypothetical protein